MPAKSLTQRALFCLGFWRRHPGPRLIRILGTAVTHHYRALQICMGQWRVNRDTFWLSSA